MKPIGSATLRHRLTPLILAFLVIPSVQGQTASSLLSARVPVEEIYLHNGIRLLLVQQPDSTTVSAGWMIDSGSANDPPNHTGLSHLLEHMLFKGTRQIGTRQAGQELELLDEIDRLWAEEQDLVATLESSPPNKRSKVTKQLSELSAQRQSALASASRLQILGEYAYLYSEQGGTGLDANTYRDMTVYYVTLPKEKLELWFWLESNRLLEPIFRQLYKEIRVIHEERRLRIESTPTGALDEGLRRRFWGSAHPYSWNPMGNPGDLDTLSREDVHEFFSAHYLPGKITVALVGGFDPVRVRTWAKEYFGRLSGGTPKRSTSMQPPAIQDSTEPVEADCSCPSQVQILYPSAPFGDPEVHSLQLLTAILNGRTGRLYRDLVLGRGIAFSAFAQQISWRRAGEFRLRVESKGEFDPEALISAWDEQVRQLREGSISLEEIRRAKNSLTADAFRLIKDPTALMKQLLIYQGLGDWRYLNRWSEAVQTVTADDLQRVAAKYLVPEARTVAVYRGPGSKVAATDPRGRE